eukprot:1175649-Prorocentrum_minimum.AAC.3
MEHSTNRSLNISPSPPLLIGGKIKCQEIVETEEELNPNRSPVGAADGGGVKPRNRSPVGAADGGGVKPRNRSPVGAAVGAADGGGVKP